VEQHWTLNTVLLLGLLRLNARGCPRNPRRPLPPYYSRAAGWSTITGRLESCIHKTRTTPKLLSNYMYADTRSPVTSSPSTSLSEGLTHPAFSFKNVHLQCKHWYCCISWTCEVEGKSIIFKNSWKFRWQPYSPFMANDYVFSS